MSSTELLMLAVALSATFLVAGCGGQEEVDRLLPTGVGEDVTIEKIEFNDSPNDQVEIRELLRYVDEAGQTVGYSGQAIVRSKSGTFPIQVLLDSNRCVELAEVVSYPYDRGSAVMLPIFTGQFEGKCSPDDMRFGTDIQAITGATVSGRAMTTGVQKILQAVAK